MNLNSNISLNQKNNLLTRNGDQILWILFIILCGISIVEVYSSASSIAYKSSPWAVLSQHLKRLLVSIGACIFVIRAANQRVLGLLPKPLLWVSLILVAITPFVGINTNNATRSLPVPLFGSFQPSELYKIAIVIYGASRLYRKGSTVNDFIKYLLAILPGIGIIALDNLSTACILVATAFFIGFLSLGWNGKFWRMIGICVGSVGMMVVFIVVAPKSITSNLHRLETWKGRIVNFADKGDKKNEADKYTIDPKDQTTFQTKHAKVAIANGGIFGKLPGNSKERDILPKAYSDYIFAIIVEELGLIGGFGVISLYLIWLIRAHYIARKTKYNYFKLIVMGITFIYVLQAFIHIMVCTDAFIVTGQPLPLISRGGSSILVCCIGIGVIQSIERISQKEHREEQLAQMQATDDMNTSTPTNFESTDNNL